MEEGTEKLDGQTGYSIVKKKGARNIVFGKYEMGRILGQGAFAKVYYGNNLATQESVAIKVIKIDQVKKQGLTEQIKREISVMRLVRHPNIVEFKEVMATKTKIFFVMEYVRGGELFAKITKGRLKEELARNYFQQLISAVDFCHSRGVYHRDLKLENLLLDENENLKVADFGLSSLPDQVGNDGLLHTQCGTPAYVAPDVLSRKGYDGAMSDIWSCGVVLFVLLSGYLPFQHENMMKMYSKIFKAEFKFPPWISIDAKKLISRVLVADPEKRITVSGIKKNSWFRKGFGRAIPFSSGEKLSREIINISEKVDHERNGEVELVRLNPPFYNAFEFISSMSSGFDLSSLFESKQKSGSTFTSKCSASHIMEKLETIAKKLNLGVSSSAKEFKVRIERKVEGRKGKPAVTAEVYEVAPEVTVVELSKSTGDTLEYQKLCEDVRPALKDIVWSWQGESSNQLTVTNYQK
ncbi:hypothetical protein JRO89_XS09G0001900 [Xanthoceras sorbifolium]|uniref:non-specific serine/threonine protein kinase n=1 Tax=Xanthoceras sorbifolium TaxID=99658 RepID=A0ABQ8HJX1_9ROSI|nr:hypothetical protein JRO89_XS09G0001900 [Xanthoceras sorbifolium]